ncbi:MAG TPA: hypothetical protein VI916_05195 [Acidimicrobiia bacterium]|nr:hypothetical protein [Acidimicrobiia bacterium]
MTRLHQRPRWLMLAALASLALVTGACSGGDDGGGLFGGEAGDAPSVDVGDDSGGSGSGDSGDDDAAASGGGANACKLLTEDDVEDAVDADVNAQPGGDQTSCSYASDPTQGNGEFVVVTLTVTSDVSAGDLRNYAELQSGFLGEAEGAPEIEDVSGVGDEAYAFDAGIAYILLVSANGQIYTVSVTGPSSAADIAKDLAKTALSRA